jgi:predicted TIM-barrel fold metal-dependent hydrolase
MGETPKSGKAANLPGDDDMDPLTEWIISVDDHVIEPPNVWLDRLPKKYQNVAPRVVHDEQGEAWLYEEKRMATAGLAAAMGRKVEEFSFAPITFDEMRPGCYDSKERIKDMDLDGVLASLCFPSMPRFCGQTFYEAQDRHLADLCIKAYNDWMIDEWCAAAPGRFIPMIIIQLWDPIAAANEIQRCAAKGARSLAFSEGPGRLGLPTIHDPGRYWDPVLKATAEVGMVINMHIGSSSFVPQPSDDSPAMAVQAWHAGVSQSGVLMDWLFSGIFLRIPNLRIALSEGGIGWIPYYLERAEQVYAKNKYWASKLDVTIGMHVENLRERAEPLPELDLHAMFRDHVMGCFIDDEHGVESLKRIGVDNVMLETDYPHSDSTWPGSLEKAHKVLGHLDAKSRYKIMQGNARRVYNFTPSADSVQVAAATKSA